MTAAKLPHDVVEALGDVMGEVEGFTDLDVAVACLDLIAEGNEPGAAGGARACLEILRDRKRARLVS